MKKGNLFILSGPSGVGKNTIGKRLKQALPKISQITTCTTRPPRPYEKQGIDYNFISKEQFQKMITNNQFLEWAKVHDHLYGTPKQETLKALEEGKQLLLIIDVQGAIHIKKEVTDAHLLFLLPENIDQLKNHLQKRKGMSPQDMALRLQNAKKELNMKNHYQYHIMNKEGEIKKTTQELVKIIKKIQSE